MRSRLRWVWLKRIKLQNVSKTFSVPHMPTWAEPSGRDAKAYGAAWQTNKRTLLLIVPSALARMEANFLLNPEHPDFSKVAYGLHQPCWWDTRLFASPIIP
jgi:RES domain-containing protein